MFLTHFLVITTSFNYHYLFVNYLHFYNCNWVCCQNVFDNTFLTFSEIKKKMWRMFFVRWCISCDNKKEHIKRERKTLRCLQFLWVRQKIRCFRFQMWLWLRDMSSRHEVCEPIKGNERESSALQHFFTFGYKCKWFAKGQLNGGVVLVLFLWKVKLKKGLETLFKIRSSFALSLSYFCRNFAVLFLVV